MRRRQSIMVGMVFASLLVTEASALDDSPGADRAEIVAHTQFSRGLHTTKQTQSRYRKKNVSKIRTHKKARRKFSCAKVKNKKYQHQAKSKSKKYQHHAKSKSKQYQHHGYHDERRDHGVTLNLHGQAYQRPQRYRTVPSYQETHRYSGDYDMSHEYDDGDDYYDSEVSYGYARVVDVQPIVTLIDVEKPERQCWQEPQRRYYANAGHNSIAPTILGGILGGVAGNQFGGGSGNDLMTVGGVLLGASVGYDISRHANNGGYRTEMETRCEVSYQHYQEERVDGYRVTYVYNGQTYVKRMRHAPGRHIKI